MEQIDPITGGATPLITRHTNTICIRPMKTRDATSYWCSGSRLRHGFVFQGRDWCCVLMMQADPQRHSQYPEPSFFNDNERKRLARSTSLKKPFAFSGFFCSRKNQLVAKRWLSQIRKQPPRLTDVAADYLRLRKDAPVSLAIARSDGVSFYRTQ